MGFLNKQMTNLFSKNWLVKKITEDNLQIEIKQYAKGSLADVGCGNSPYKKILKPFITKYTGIDHQETQHDKSNIDIFSTAYEIPVSNESFDTILCTAVLEHLENSESAIKEANRMLKKNGIAIYTIPFFWHLHEEPRDFFRYTKYGIKHIFEKNKFDIITIKPLSGFCVTFGQELVYYIWRFRRNNKLNPFYYLIPLLSLLIQTAALWLNKIDKSNEFTWMYIVVAQKKHE